MKNRRITIRMPKEDLAAWLRALRSPQNRRRQRALTMFSHASPGMGGHKATPSGYCCLGVAQVVKTGGYLETYYDRPELLEKLERNEKIGYANYPSMKWLAEQGWEWYDRYGKLCRDPFLPTLDMDASTANDSGNYSFRKIANAIEACAEGY